MVDRRADGGGQDETGPWRERWMSERYNDTGWEGMPQTSHKHRSSQNWKTAKVSHTKEKNLALPKSECLTTGPTTHS